MVHHQGFEDGRSPDPHPNDRQPPRGGAENWAEDQARRHAVPIPRYPEPERLYEAAEVEAARPISPIQVDPLSAPLAQVAGEPPVGYAQERGGYPVAGDPRGSTRDATLAVDTRDGRDAFVGETASGYGRSPQPQPPLTGPHAPPATAADPRMADPRLHAPSPGEPMPDPHGAGPHLTEPVDTRYQRVSENVYAPRRPGVFLVLIFVVVPLLLPALVLLGRATFGDHINPGGVVAAVAVILALPLFATGVYPLLRGHRPTLERASVQVLRPPYIWVLISLALLVAAAIAAS